MSFALRVSRICFSVAVACVSMAAGSSYAASTVHYVDVQDIPVPANAGISELAFAPAYGKLFIRIGATEVRVLDLATMKTTSHTSSTRFTNMSLSPAGGALFVADYGGENIGYGTPSGQSYVHRYNLAKGTWSVDTAYIAGNVQAMSDTTLLLKSDDQWITFTNDAYGTQGALKILNSSSGWWTLGYDPGVYEGDFRYDPHSGRLLHGEYGISSVSLHAWTLANNEFVPQEGVGVPAAGYGYPTIALANDGSQFFYGPYAFDATNLQIAHKTFPESIYAATGAAAFGDGQVYNAHTASRIQSLGFSTTIYGLSPTGTDFWTYDAAANMLRHFVDQGQ